MISPFNRERSPDHDVPWVIFRGLGMVSAFGLRKLDDLRAICDIFYSSVKIAAIFDSRTGLFDTPQGYHDVSQRLYHMKV